MGVYYKESERPDRSIPLSRSSRPGFYNVVPWALLVLTSRRLHARHLGSSADSTAFCAAAHMASASPAGMGGCTVMTTLPGKSRPSLPALGRKARMRQRRQAAHRCA